MTEYTMTYTLEITEIHQVEEENPGDLLRLAQHMLDQEQWVRKQLSADDVHIRKFNMFIREK